MKPWLAVRVLFVFAAFLQGLLMEHIAPPPFDVPALLLAVIFLAAIYGILFVIGIPAANPLSSKLWHYPSWQINPFLIQEPLQFLHFVGHYFFALGVGVLLRHVFYAGHIGPGSFLYMAIAGGILVGVWVCTAIYYRKMSRGTQF